MSREMKNSGIPWIGEVPDNWDVFQTSTLFHEHKQKNVGLTEKNLLSLSYGSIKRKDINSAEGLLPASFETYNIVSEGDIVFRLTDLQNDKLSLRTGLCKERGIITSAYQALRPNRTVDSRYFHYLYHSYDVCKVFYGIGDGVRQGAGYEDLRKLLVLLPPFNEQKTIADFLDKQCSEIDSMISLQEKIVEELKAYQYAIIGEVTTKGLNKNSSMIESGIDWVGEMPSHWNISTFKEFGIESEEKNKGNKTSELLALSYSLGVTLYKDKIYNKDRVKNDYEEYKIVRKGDIVLSPNDIIKGSIFVSKYDGCISPMYLIFHPRNPKTHNLQFLSYLLRNKSVGRRFFFMARGLIGEILDNGKYVTRRMTVARNDIVGFKVLLPPAIEQEQIVSYLDTICADIESLIKLKHSKIESLKEYKKSIIYEYVTGKKEVIE